MRLLLLFSFLMVIMAAIEPQGEASAGQGSADNRYAVIVGIDNYDNGGVNPLRYAVSDACAMRELLIQRMGFNSDNIYLFTSDRKEEKKPQRTNVTFAMEQIAKEMKPGGTFVFFFSGHGMQFEKESYLLTIDADPRSKTTCEDSCLKITRVQDLIENMKADKVLVMIDACRSDPRGNKAGGSKAMDPQFAKGLARTIVGEQGALQKAEPKVKVRAMLQACSPGESSYESGDLGNGYFTHFLIQGLCGEAANPKGQITLTSLGNYLSHRVSVEVKKDKGDAQTPWLESSGSNIDEWSLSEGRGPVKSEIITKNIPAPGKKNESSEPAPPARNTSIAAPQKQAAPASPEAHSSTIRVQEKPPESQPVYTPPAAQPTPRPSAAKTPSAAPAKQPAPASPVTKPPYTAPAAQSTPRPAATAAPQRPAAAPSTPTQEVANSALAMTLRSLPEERKGVLIVSNGDDTACFRIGMEVRNRLKKLRSDGVIQGIRLLAYDFGVYEQKKYCQGTLDIQNADLPLLTVVELHPDSTPKKILWRMKVQDVDDTMRQLLVNMGLK